MAATNKRHQVIYNNIISNKITGKWTKIHDIIQLELVLDLRMLSEHADLSI